MNIGKIKVTISGPLAMQVAANVGIRKALRREFQDALRLVLTMWGCENAGSYHVELEHDRPVVIVGHLSNCEMWQMKGGE